MPRRKPDVRQGLFAWVWGDPDGERPGDAEEEDDEPPPAPPLRDRVRSQREGSAVLWGVPITVRPRRAAARSAG